MINYFILQIIKYTLSIVNDLYLFYNNYTNYNKLLYFRKN